MTEYKIIKRVCKDEEGKRWEEELVGYCATLKGAFNYIEKQGHTILKWDGFANPKFTDTRSFKYAIEEKENLIYLD
jgi:hypothetical protein